MPCYDLTTYRQPLEAMVEALVSLQANVEAGICGQLLGELVVRGSTSNQSCVPSGTPKVLGDGGRGISWKSHGASNSGSRRIHDGQGVRQG